MLKMKIRNCVVASLYVLPLITGAVYAQDQNRGGNQRNNETSRMSNTQRSGYLGRLSESVILAGNLDALQSTADLDDFYDDIESVKERVQFWHTVAIDTVALDHTADPDIEDYSPSQGGPTRTSRALAMVQIAVFDALNHFEQEYQSYTPALDGFENASEHTAIAYAAYNTLVALYPQQAARLAELLAEDVSRIASFTDEDPQAQGQTLGTSISEAILLARAEDGSNHNEPNFGEGGEVADGTSTYYGTYVNGGSRLTGEWTPDPNTPDFSGDYNLSLGAYWGKLRPFFLESGDQFRVPAPPEFDSEEYAEAYAITASVGGSLENTFTPSTSTDDTRFIANYWGYDGVPLIGVPPRVYNQILSQIASAELDDAVDLARVLALVNVGMADAAIAAWDSKYYYNFWRPVTGIRADDGAVATVTDEDWDPIGVSVVNTEEAIRATPPFPAYPSGHATFGAVTFEVLREMFGDNTAFTFVSDEYNGEGVDPFFPNIPRAFVPVRFSTLSDAQEQNGVSRIYNGVHWEFDDTAGQELGVQIGQYLLEDTTAFSSNNQNDGRDGGGNDGRDGGGNDGRDGGGNDGRDGGGNDGRDGGGNDGRNGGGNRG